MTVSLCQGDDGEEEEEEEGNFILLLLFVLRALKWNDLLTKVPHVREETFFSFPPTTSPS